MVLKNLKDIKSYRLSWEYAYTLEQMDNNEGENG